MIAPYAALALEAPRNCNRTVYRQHKLVFPNYSRAEIVNLYRIGVPYCVVPGGNLSIGEESRRLGMTASEVFPLRWRTSTTACSYPYPMIVRRLSSPLDGENQDNV